VKPTTPSQPEPTLKQAAAPKQGKAPASRKEGRTALPAVEAPQQAPMKKKVMTGKSSPPSCFHSSSQPVTNRDL
jgi:hypothetical protein